MPLTRRKLLFGVTILTAWRTLPVFALDSSPSGSPGRRSIAIPNFNANTKAEIEIARELADTITAGLAKSNLFNITKSNAYVYVDALPDFALWQERKADILIMGRVSIFQNRFKIEYRVWDVLAGKQVKGQLHFDELNNLSDVAHLMSETITNALR